VVASSPTLASLEVDNGDLFSANCRVSLDYGNPYGKIIDVREVVLTVPNTQTAGVADFGSEQEVTNDRAGTTIYAEAVIFLP
jgi:hypothetical protein